MVSRFCVVAQVRPTYFGVRIRDTIPLDQAHMGKVNSLDSTSVNPALLIQFGSCKAALGFL